MAIDHRKLPRTAPPSFNISASFIVEETQRMLDNTRQLEDSLVRQINPEDASFANVFRPLADNDNRAQVKIQYFASFSSLSPSSDLREASSNAIDLIEKADLATYLRDDLFILVKAVRCNDVNLDVESRRLVDRHYDKCIQNGLHLPSGPNRQKFQQIQQRVIELRTKFMSLMGEQKKKVWLEPDELDGLAEAKVALLDRDDSTEPYKVGLPIKPPYVFEALDQCKVQETRKTIAIARESVEPESVALFTETVLLRDEAARLAGYPNHATSKLAGYMAKSVEHVKGMLEKLYQGLEPLAREEVRRLLEIAGLQQDKMTIWDLGFCQRVAAEQSIDRKVEQLSHSDYFPAKTTLASLLDIFQKLFGLKIIELTESDLDKISLTGVGKDCLWHKDVQIFAVWDDEKPEEDEEDFLGYLYTDVYPRDGKYPRSASLNIQPSFIDENGDRNPAAVVLCSNISTPAEGMPPTLKHSEIVKLFHELGHGMHDLVSKTNFGRFSGTGVSPDFVEAPSQLLEYWCWLPECLKSISCHYSYLSPEYAKRWHHLNPGKPQPPREIPQDLVQDITKAKGISPALDTLYQVAFSMFDMAIHCPESRKSLEEMSFPVTFNQIRERVSLRAGPDDPRSSHPYLNSSHLMWGYDASYYSYLYTKVFAADIWHSMFAHDPMNTATSKRYRHMVLEKGGSQDEMKTLVEFLGREPQVTAFNHDLGLGVQ